MPTAKDSGFLDPRTKVRVIRQRRDDLADLDYSESVLAGVLSDGKQFIQTPVIERPFGLCSPNNPEKCGFFSPTPIIAIILYENGWMVMTEDAESYNIILEDRGLSQ